MLVIKHIKNQDKHNLTTQSTGTSTRLTPCNAQGLSTSSCDRWNRVAEIRDHSLLASNNRHIAKHYIYDDFGRVTNISFAFGDNTTPPRIAGADRIGALVSPTVEDLGEVFESFSYTFDRNNNITSEHHIVDLEGTEPHDELREYTFNPRGMLTRSQSSVSGTVEYGWDRAGNRRYVYQDDFREWSDFNGLNQLAEKHTADGVVRYSYDYKGNQTQEVGPNHARVFNYNVDNRLTRAQEGTNLSNLTTINTNTFRGDGQRISKVEGNQTINYIYRSGAVLYITDHNHNPINLHLKDPAGAVIGFAHFRNGGNPTSNVTQDIRQSTSTVLDANFDFLTGFRYTDFGITTRLQDTYELIEIAYTGGIWDESTGLYYLNARFYNPVDARFMQIDVARNGGDLRATLSLYGYCEGDPINKVDPSGYASWRTLAVRMVTRQDMNRAAISGAVSHGLSFGFGFIPIGSALGRAVASAAITGVSQAIDFRSFHRRMMFGDKIRTQIRGYAFRRPHSSHAGGWRVSARIELLKPRHERRTVRINNRLASRYRVVGWNSDRIQRREITLNVPRNHGGRAWNNGNSVALQPPRVRVITTR